MERPPVTRMPPLAPCWIPDLSCDLAPRCLSPQLAAAAHPAAHPAAWDPPTRRMSTLRNTMCLVCHGFFELSMKKTRGLKTSHRSAKVWCRPPKIPFSSRNWHSHGTVGTGRETLMSGVCRRAAALRNTVYGGRRRVPGVVRRGAPSVSEPTLSVNRGARQGQTRLGWTARRARWTR